MQQKYCFCRLSSTDVDIICDFLTVCWGLRLEIYGYLAVDLPTRQIVGHGPLPVGDVSYPIVTVDIRDAEEVEAVEPYPDVLDCGAAGTVVRTVGQETHADVGTLIGRCAELLLFESSMWGTEGQAVGKSQTECHFPTVGTREIVGEMEIDGISLVCRGGDPLTIVFLSGAHQGECEP